MKQNEKDTSQFDFNMMSNEGIVTNLVKACKSVATYIKDINLADMAKNFVERGAERGGYNPKASFEANKKELLSFIAYKVAYATKQRR